MTGHNGHSEGHTPDVKRLFAIALAGLVLMGCAEAGPPTPPAADGPDDIQAPDTLEVRCDGETTEILTPAVQAQVDGVHVLIHNVLPDERLSVTTETTGDGASPGDTTLVFPILPGTSRIRCLRETEDNAMENGDWGEFTVIEPPGWVSPQLADCPNEVYQSNIDYVVGARGVEDPLKDAEEHFRLEGDAVEAGYRTAEERTIVNATAEGPKESLVYVSDGSGGWLLSQTSGCS
jgi:hypothetical protein